MYWYLIISLQIVLEMLPVSSSGHILLLEQFIFCFMAQIVNINFSEQVSQAIIHVMHLPTLFVLGLFFGYRWYNYLLHPIRLWNHLITAALFVITADIVTVALFFTKPAISATYLPLGLVITIAALTSLIKCPQTVNKPLRFRDAFIIGFVQGIALLPGISRLASVFVVTRWLGYSNRQAFEIAWMVQVPLIMAAASKGLLVMYKQNAFIVFNDYYFWIIVGVATLLSWSALQLCYWLVRSNRIWWCAVYLVVPLIISLLLTQCR